MSSDQIPTAEEGSVMHNGESSDKASFEMLFKQYFAPLCSYCEINYGLPPEVARDIVQAAFLKFWESRHNLLSYQAAKSYLYRIVTNSSLDLLRHDKIKGKRAKHILQAGEGSILNKGFENL